MQFSADSRALALKQDRLIRVRKTRTNVDVLLPHLNPIIDLMFMDDSSNRLLSLMEPGYLLLWDVHTVSYHVLFHPSKNRLSCVFHYSNDLIVMGFQDQKMLWALRLVMDAGKEMLRKIDFAFQVEIYDVPTCVVIAQEREKVFCVQKDGHLCLCEADRTSQVVALEGSPELYALGTGNDEILVAGKQSSGIWIYVLNHETLSYKIVKVDGYGPPLKPVQVTFLPSCQYVAVGSEASFIDILHIDTGAISRIETDVNAIDGLAAVSKLNSKDVMLARGSFMRNETQFLLYTIREDPPRRKWEKVV